MRALPIGCDTQHGASAEPLAPVRVVLERNLPRCGGAFSAALVHRLVRWSDANPDPYWDVHWPG
jgi:hypothetical protein